MLKLIKKMYQRFVENNDIKKLYHKWISENCEKSIYGRRLRKIKNIHYGEKCIIVGNGPSLLANDLDMINDSGIITFGTNRVFKIFGNTKWRPTYYVSEDPNIIKGCCDEIDAVPAKIKFLPLQIIWYETRKRFKNTLYFWQNYDHSKDYKYSFSTSIDKQIDHTNTITCTCVAIAAYMGFKEIYLIGVDHNYRISVNEKGEKVLDNMVKDHFCDNYNNKYNSNTEPPDLGKTTQSYINAKKYCEENGIKIYNATRGGKLEVFERKSLDDVIVNNNQYLV